MNKLPDLIYASVTYHGDQLVELYAARRRMRRVLSWRHAYMEDLCQALANEFRDADEVSIRLAFDRHEVRICPRVEFDRIAHMSYHEEGNRVG